MVAVENWHGLGKAGLANTGERCRQLVESAAKGLHVTFVEQAGGRGCLRWLIRHVVPQVRASQAAAQLDLGVVEAVLGRIVGPLHDRHDLLAGFERHRMSEELVEVAVEVLQHDCLGADLGRLRRRCLDHLAQVVAVLRNGGVDRGQPCRSASGAGL